MSSTDPKCMKNSFQIEDIAKIIPMLKGLLLDCWSFELLLHFATINIGMMFAISSICKSFVPLYFFWFFAGIFFKIKSIEHWRPDPGDPPKRGVQKYLRPGPASIPFSNRRYWHYFPEVPITSPKKGKSRFQMRFPSQAQKKTRKFRFQIEDIGIIFQRFPSQAQKKGNPVFKKKILALFSRKAQKDTEIPSVFKWGSHHKPRKNTEIPFSNRKYWHYFPEVAITSQKKQRKSRFQIEDIGIIFQRFPSQAQKKEIPFSNRRYWHYFPEKPKKTRKSRSQMRFPSQAQKKHGNSVLK